MFCRVNNSSDESWYSPPSIIRVCGGKNQNESVPFMNIDILGDPGAVSRTGLKGATKVFKHGRKSPWLPTLTGPFPNGHENSGS